MILRNSDLDKVRCGQFKCPSCGTFYDPTYGPCPECNKKYDLATICFAIVVLLFLLFWLPLEGAAKAQTDPQPTCWVEPDGTVLCISAISSTPFVPTDTPVPPTVAPTATATPTGIILLPWKRFAYLPLIVVTDTVTGDVK